MARIADREDPPTGTDQRSGIQPAAYGLLAGAQVDPAQGQPGVEQDHRGVPVLGDRFGAGRRHDDVGPVGDGGPHPVAAGGADGGRGEGPAELLGGAGVAEDRGAQAAMAALGAGPVVVDGRAPAARGRRRRTGQRERAGAHPAAGGGAAALAGEAGDVAEPGRLHQHRAGLEAVADRPGRLRRHARRAGARVASQLLLRGTRDAHRHPLADDRAGWRDLAGPAGAQQVRRLDGPAEPADQGGRPLLLGAQQQRLSGVGVRRALLGVEVVAVVPDRDQAEVADRGEGGRAGAGDDPAGAAADGEEVAVAGGGTAVGGERHVVSLAEDLGQRGVEPVEVLLVRHAEQGAPTRGVRRGGGVGEQEGPVGGGRGGPDGPWRAPVGEVLEEGGAVLVVGPGCFAGGRVDARGRRCG